MRKSQAITLTLLAAIAAMACDENQTQLKHCVDENGVVQDESKCAGVPDHHPDGGTVDPQHPYNGTHFFWFYGGTNTYTPGTRITTGGGSGSYTPSVGQSYSPPSISRGGFGGTGESFGGGGGG